MYRSSLLFLLVTASLHAHAGQSALQGNWQVIWSCNDSVGSYAERCAQGDRDSFSLSILVRGSKVCGSHFATAHLGNRVDEGELLDGKPTIDGIFNGSTASVNFRSAWGATGTADLILDGNKLHWKVVNQSDGISWLPREAVLIRIHVDPGSARALCSK